MDKIISQYLEVQNLLLLATIKAKEVNFHQVKKILAVFDFDRQIMNLEQLPPKPPTAIQEPELLKEKIENLKQKLKKVIATAEENGVTIPLEKMSVNYRLNEDEKTILLTLFFARFNLSGLTCADLLKIVSADLGEIIGKLNIFFPESSLRRNGLIAPKQDFFTDKEDGPLAAEFRITDDAFYQICGIEPPGKTGPTEDEGKFRSSNNLLWVKEPEVTFEQLILPEWEKERIMQALWQHKNLEQAFRDYYLEGKIAYGKGTAMLFYGLPGTGKTATAEAIAHHLGKKIGYVRYHELYNRFVGGSEKNLKRVFEEAKNSQCLLLFDEADACFGARLIESHATDRMHNLMTNILMQEMERFDGLIILTTNRDFAIDQAFERRILLRLEFKIPRTGEREKIWQFFLKGCPKLAPDVSLAQLAERYPLTGGKIKNAVLKAMIAAARASRSITMSDLEQAAGEELGQNGRKVMGFSPA